MKQIADTIGNLQQKELQTNLMKSQKETLKKTDLPSHWVTEIFRVFQARYLSKWSGQISGIEERAVTEWASGLGMLNGEQIKNGLDNWCNSWPPSLDEFRNCCLNISGNDDWRKKNAGHNEYIRALPAPKNKDLAKKSMKEIKDILGIKP